MKDKVWEFPTDGTKDFCGDGYDRALDIRRLSKQCNRIWALMVDGKWRTLDEIAEITHDPEASISAQLRAYRRKKFGEHTVERRRRGDPGRGHWEYKLIPNIPPAPSGDQLGLL